MMRFRDDKLHGNFSTSVDSIIQSIMEDVKKDDVRAILTLEDLCDINTNNSLAPRSDISHSNGLENAAGWRSK